VFLYETYVKCSSFSKFHHIVMTHIYRCSFSKRTETYGLLGKESIMTSSLIFRDS